MLIMNVDVYIAIHISMEVPNEVHSSDSTSIISAGARIPPIDVSAFH